MGIHSRCCYIQFVVAGLDGSHSRNITLLYIICEHSDNFFFFLFRFAYRKIELLIQYYLFNKLKTKTV